MDIRGNRPRRKQGTCRLCPSKESLEDIFSPKHSEMPQIILTTTGIQIKQDDLISKQVCSRCIAIIIRLYKYKTTAVAYDKELKEDYGLPYTPPISIEVNHQQTPTERKTRKFKAARNVTENSECRRPDESVPTNRNKSSPKAEPKHPSVSNVLSTYKNLIIPKEVLCSDINPVILLDKSEVTMWYEEQLLHLKHKFKGIKFKKMPDSVTLNVAGENKKRLFKEKKMSDAGKTVSNTKILSGSNSPSSHEFVSNKNGRCSFPSSQIPSSEGNKSVTPSLNENRGKMSSNLCKNQNGNSADLKSLSKNEGTNLADSQLVSSPNVSLLNIKKEVDDPLTLAKTSENMKGCVNINNREKNKASNFETEQIPEIKRKRLISNDEELGFQKKQKLSSKLEKNEVDKRKKHINELKNSCKSVSMPELVQGKSLEIFVCDYCNTLFDTIKGLIDHEKNHLTCKFCKTIVGNAELLRKHIKETCLIIIAKNLPIIKLTRVDTVPDILLQYPNAFNINNRRHSIEQILLPESTETNFMTYEDVPLTTNFIPYPQVNRLSPLCASTESNSDIDCEEIVLNSDIPTKTISPLVKFDGETIDLTIESSVDIIPNYKSVIISQNNMSEHDAIRMIFRKHVNKKGKNASPLNEQFTQMFNPVDSGVKYTSSNLIILDGLFPDLSKHQIPIQFVSRPRINVTFSVTLTTSSQLENSAINESWRRDDCVDIKQNYCGTTGDAMKTITPANQFPFSQLSVSDVLKQIPCFSIDNSVLLNAHGISSTPFNALLQQTPNNSMALATVANNSVQPYSKDSSVLLNAHGISSTPFNALLQQTPNNSVALATVANNSVQPYSNDSPVLLNACGIPSTPFNALLQQTPNNSMAFATVANSSVQPYSKDSSVLLNSHGISSTPLNALLRQTPSNSMALPTVTNNSVQQYSKKSFVFDRVQSSATITGESVVISTVTQSADKDDAQTGRGESIVNISNNVTNINKIYNLADLLK